MPPKISKMHYNDAKYEELMAWFITFEEIEEEHMLFSEQLQKYKEELN